MRNFCFFFTCRTRQINEKKTIPLGLQGTLSIGSSFRLRLAVSAHDLSIFVMELGQSMCKSRSNLLEKKNVADTSASAIIIA